MTAPGKIMLIRHGEKPGGSAGALGVTRPGHASEHALTVRGWQRAGALAALFGGDRLVPASLAVPDRLICPEYPDGKNHRVHQTLEPLAGRLGLEIHRVGATDRPKDAAALALSSAGSVLLCWDHSDLPALARLIPSAVAVPDVWPPERFDLVWVFDLVAGPSPSYAFSVAGQNVLDGDQHP